MASAFQPDGGSFSVHPNHRSDVAHRRRCYSERPRAVIIRAMTIFRRRFRALRAGCLLALVCFGLVSVAPASIIRYMPLDRMAVEADSILVGQVIGVRSRMGVRRNRIHTYVTIQVDRYLKGGAASARITLRLLGGSAEGYRLVVPGMPEFELHENVLVFVEEAEGRVPGVFGLSAGKLSLAPHPETGELMTHRTLAGLTVQDADGNPGVLPPAATRIPATLAEVETVIGRALAALPLE